MQVMVLGVEERERFWNDFDKVVDIIGNEYRLCATEDLNKWGGDSLRVGITSTFVILEENNSEKRLIEYCAERRLCVVNTYLKYKSLHKYNMVARCLDGMEIMIIADLVLLK